MRVRRVSRVKMAKFQHLLHLAKFKSDYAEEFQEAAFAAKRKDGRHS